jgi:Flp pilus assembly protein TadD
VLTRRPKDPLSANNYASLLLERDEEPATAARALEVARALEGTENPYFLDTLGWAKFRAGDVEGAIADLQKAVAAAPGLAEARYHLGAALLAAGRTEEARAELAKAIADGGAQPFVARARGLLAQN